MQACAQQLALLGGPLHLQGTPLQHIDQAEIVGRHGEAVAHKLGRAVIGPIRFTYFAGLGHATP